MHIPVSFKQIPVQPSRDIKNMKRYYSTYLSMKALSDAHLELSLVLFEPTVHGLLSLVLKVLDLFAILLNFWEDEVVVDGGGSESWWVEKIHQESQFQEVVEWDESKDDSSELINNIESSKANPVSQPLFIIIESISLKSQETHESWVGNAQKIGDIAWSNAKHNHHDSKDKSVLHEWADWLSSGFWYLIEKIL